MLLKNKKLTKHKSTRVVFSEQEESNSEDSSTGSEIFIPGNLCGFAKRNKKLAKSTAQLIKKTRSNKNQE